MYSNPSSLFANIDVTVKNNIDIRLTIQHFQPFFTMGDILRNLVILILKQYYSQTSIKGNNNNIDCFFLAFFKVLKLLPLLCAKNAKNVKYDVQ